LSKIIYLGGISGSQILDVIMTKPRIALFLQHYLTPSMTFVYRQLLETTTDFHPLVFTSHKLENLDLFPFTEIYFRQRNFIKIKSSRAFNKIYGQNKLLSRKPRLSEKQKLYFSELISKNKVRLIHAHFAPSGLEILPVIRKLNVPLVVNFHGYDGSLLLKYKDYRERLKKLFNDSVILLPSNFMLNEIRKNVGEIKNYDVIYIGIPVTNFKFVERQSVRRKVEKKERIIFLQVSNFVKKKGHIFTILAFNKLLKFYENVELVLAGDGYLKEEIQKCVMKLGISDKVVFLGKVNQEEVITLMNSADVFLHHSITSDEGDKEGIPTVLMEAMATGLPCVSTVHAGIPELITDGINGFLIEERDIEGYVQKMVSLFEKDWKFSNQARKTVINNFNLEIQAERLKELFSKLIK